MESPSRPGGFLGQFRLDNLSGTYWNDYSQTGALELSAKNDGIVGGSDRVKITANGSAITFSSNYTWVNVGTDSITATLNTVNLITVWKVSKTELNYVVKIL
jgi:hypothetical protein